MLAQLSEINSSMVKLSHPLPWDVFTAQGKLLLHKGSVITSESQRERLLEFGMYASKADVHKQRAEGVQQAFDPFHEWDNLRGWLRRLNLEMMKLALGPEPGPMPDLLSQVDQVARRIQAATVKAADASIFEIMQMDTTHYVVAHHLRAAALCGILARSMGWTDQCVLNACRAALTMNVGMLELQTVLSTQATPLSAPQRKVVDEHGAAGRRLLQAIGVLDEQWLCAVEWHHPERAAPGAQIPPLARLVQHVDIYLAKITPRAYRAARDPQAAARELLQDPRIDKGLMSLLIKTVGIYPPGSYVKLANGDNAVVVRRGASAHTPAVCALVSGAGTPLMEPVVRDTSQAKFAVASLVAKNKVMVLYNPAELFRLTGGPP